MEEHKEQNVENWRKRVRDDPTGDSTESKLARVESANSVDNSADELNPDLSTSSTSDSIVNSAEAKRIQDDLLSILDESNPDPEIQGLDSVIKSFEEEILFPGELFPTMISKSGETRPELGYLLEASDDELGLPPSFSLGDEIKKMEEAVELKTTGSSSSVALDDIGLGFDDGVLSFEPYRFAVDGQSDNNVNYVSNDFITLGGGLFDSYEQADISDITWRPESLPAS